MSTHVLVTPNIDEDKQQLITDFFSEGTISVDFLSSVPNEKRNDILSRAEVLLTFDPLRDLNEEEYAHLDHIRFMQLLSAGADHLSYSRIPAHITVASNNGAYAKPIAEHVLAMALCLAKRLREEHQNMQQGEFNQFALNKSIRDSTVGILGFGGIGKASANLFRAFGSRIFAMNTSGQSDEPTDFMGTSDDLQHILEESDIVVLSLPLTNKTRGMIGSRQLQWMQPDAIFINVARGEIVDQEALYHHLKNHPDFKAGLESWWVEPLRHGSFELAYPFLELPNVLASPHNSSAVPDVMEHSFIEAIKNIKRYLNGKSFKGKINRQLFI